MADDPREKETPTEITVDGKTFPALADGEYDAIVLGTGLKECIMSGLLAVKGLKVLHLDRNDYYGGECASLNPLALHEKFAGSPPPPELLAALGEARDFNVDLIPKFLMANGKLVKILVHTDVTRYLDFKQIDGSFVYKASNHSVHKVPVTEMEALSTSLMGFFQKRKFRNFLQYTMKLDAGNPGTFDGLDPEKTVARAVFDKFGLDSNSVDFTGHALALQSDESYLDKPFAPLAKAIKLYALSLERYGKSPYIYPVYGLGGLPESFSRLCAVNRGTFMLHARECTVHFEEGKAVGVTAISPMSNETEAARAPLVIGDPSYFAPEKSRKVGQVIRSICLLDHPIDMIGGCPSAQIILPQNQIGRKNDIYVTVVSSDHMVAAKGRYVAIVSTTVETSDPRAEVEPGIRLLGRIMVRYDNIANTMVPVADGKGDNCYISSSLDASSHFETTADDVLDMYARVTGEPLNMEIPTEVPTA